MSLLLDGSTRYVGTEFIKLLNTGSSNLATEEFVTNAVAGGGGGAVDAYTKTETDNLLDTKLNINNPQNMEGTLNIGNVGGTSKIIINALSSTKDFYCNGDAQVLGNHLVQSLDSTSYIKGTNLISNTINADNLNDIFFQSNGANYLQLDVSENKLVSSKLIQCGGNLTTQEIDTIAPLDLVIKRNGVDYITLADGQVNFNQPTNISVDTSNLVKKTGETDQKIDGTISVNGDTITGYKLIVNGQIHTQGMFVAPNTNLIFGNPNIYIANPPSSNHIRHYTNGEHQFYCNGVEDFLIDQYKALARGNMLCVGQFQGNVYNSFNNTNSDVSFKKANIDYIKLGGDLSMVEMPKGYNTENIARLEFMRHRKTNQDIQLSQPLFMNRQKLEFHKVASKEVFIDNFLESTVEVLQLRNNDTTGQIRCVIGGSNIMDMVLVELNIYQDTEVANGQTLTATVVAHSDKKLKCDIKNIDNNFGNIVKLIEPKTFKVICEKELGIYKNHIGFIAQDVEEHISGDFENIVCTGKDGMKKLNYVNMNCITWGAVRELIEEKKNLKSKVEHLESRLFEVENFIKDASAEASRGSRDYVKPKPKAKTKVKSLSID